MWAAPSLVGTVVGSLLKVPDQIAFAGGVALVLVGVVLRWRLGEYLMQMEEETKDGWLTEDQARRRIRILTISGPVAILIGLTACAIVVWS